MYLAKTNCGIQQWFSKFVFRPELLAKPENLSEMHIFRPYHRLSWIRIFENEAQEALWVIQMDTKVYEPLVCRV